MTDGKHKKRVKIQVNGESRDDRLASNDPASSAGSRQPANEAGPGPGEPQAGPDLTVADAVDVAFDDILADARGSRSSRKPKSGASSPAATAEAGAGDAGVAEVIAGEAQAVAGAESADGVSAQRDEYLRHLQRLQADFDNYRKRVQRDNEMLTRRAGEGVVESLLPVIDNMQRALVAAHDHEADALVEGVELVAGQFRAVLESHGLEDVPAEPGMPFDPTVHEAIVAQPSDDYAEGSITQVLEAGYLLHGRLLRPTKVIVAA